MLDDVNCMECNAIAWVSCTPFIHRKTYGVENMVCICGATGQILSITKPAHAQSELELFAEYLK